MPSDNKSFGSFSELAIPAIAYPNREWPCEICGGTVYPVDETYTADAYCEDCDSYYGYEEGHALKLTKKQLICLNNHWSEWET